MTEYKTKRIIDKKPPLRWVIVDETGKVVNRNPSEEELKCLKKEQIKPRDTRLYTDKELLDYLKHFKNENGRSPGQKDFENNPEYPNYGVYRKRFGSWNNALALVELDINKGGKKYVDEELLDYLKQFHQENGRIPMTTDFENNPEYPNYSIYRKRFGSWNNALILTGLGIRKKDKYTNEELLDYLKQFYQENERVPIARDFEYNPEHPNVMTYIKRFGSWNNALKLVEMDLDTRVVQGNLTTGTEKGRYFEIKLMSHFENRPIDLSGRNCHSYHDGICPNGQLYEVKSASMRPEGYWPFGTENKDKDDDKEAIQWYYFGAFNKDYTKLLYVWRVPGEIVEGTMFHIGVNNGYKFNVENMKQYDITDKFKDIMNT